MEGLAALLLGLRLDERKTPGDPLWYISKNSYMAKDFVKSWDLVDEFRQFVEGRPAPAASSYGKATGKGSKRTWGDADRGGPANARRMS